MKFFSGPRGNICLTCRKKKRKAYSHSTRIKETYGITKEQYNLLLEYQGGGCAICQGKRKYNLDVDHDHKTGFVRGLLCKSCNRKILPYAKDNPQVLRNAANYLDNPPAHLVIGFIKGEGE